MYSCVRLAPALFYGASSAAASLCQQREISKIAREKRSKRSSIQAPPFQTQKVEDSTFASYTTKVASRGLLKLTSQGRDAAEQIGRRASLAVELAGKDLNEEERTCFYKAKRRTVKSDKSPGKN